MLQTVFVLGRYRFCIDFKKDVAFNYVHFLIFYSVGQRYIRSLKKLEWSDQIPPHELIC